MSALPHGSFLSPILDEVKASPLLVLVAASFIILSFSTYLILDTEWVCRLGEEDGFFEYLTALLFFVASLIFLQLFLRKKNAWFLLFSIFFLVGFGEEISWGQRILGYLTPDSVNKLNVQHELTIHNLEPLNASNFDGTHKTGVRKLVVINTLFHEFCIVYGILLPIGFLFFRPVQVLTQKIRLPLPPFSLGIFFLISYLVMRIMGFFVMPGNEPLQYVDTANEIDECCDSLIWSVIGLYFRKTTKESK